MAAPYPDQQAYQPPHQPYQQPPEGGYQPAPAQFPSQQTKPFPDQGKPPGYEYGGQPGYGSTNTTVVVSSQPTPVTTAYDSVSFEQDYSGMAVCALVFSIITLLCTGASLLCLTCSIPALILAIVALGTTGSAQKSNAAISIGLNVTVVVCTVLFLIVLIPVLVFGTKSCGTYYDSYYNSYCIPYSYTGYYCIYYSIDGYCP